MPDDLAARAGSLAEARAAIPPECRRRSDAIGAVSVAVDVTAYLAVITLLAVTTTWWIELPLMVLAGLLVGAMFILGHDAAHGTLFANARLNRLGARLLMLPALHVTEAWVLGHNRIHHGYTTQQGMDFVWHPLTPAEYASLGRLARLRHRFEWSCLGSGLYYARTVWWYKMLRFRPPRKWVRSIRRDLALVALGAIAATAATALAGWLRTDSLAGALWMPTKLLVVPFLIFTQVIGWTVYVHHIAPDIAWSSRRDWNPLRAQMGATTILRLPAPLRPFFHNIFVHVPHHVDTRIPWHRLRRAAAALGTWRPDLVTERPLRLRDYLSSTRRCKLYDFERQCWLTYRAARRTVSPTPGSEPR